MKALVFWFVSRWRWMRGRCPACGANMRTLVIGMAPGTRCRCGFWASYTIDGSVFWNFPPEVGGSDK